MTESNKKTILFILLSLAAGLIIGWIDTSPGWDDTGITIVLILISSFTIGFFANKNHWLLALIIGICVTFLNYIASSKLDSAISLLFAFAGVYSGAGLRYLIKK